MVLKVYEEQPCVTPPLLQVGQCSMDKALYHYRGECYLKTGKEVVQLLRQRGIPFGSPEVGPVVGGVLDSLPHLPAVVAVQLVLDPSPVVQLGHSPAAAERLHQAMF